MRRPNPISETFRGLSGGISSKRVMMFLSFCMMILMAVFSTIYSMKVEQFIFDGFLYIVVGGLFSVASEKFSSAFKKVDGEKSETNNN